MRYRDIKPPKHIHRWKLTKREAPQHWDMWGFYNADSVDVLTLHRECEGCLKKQKAEVTDASVLVPGYENIADVDWKDK